MKKLAVSLIMIFSVLYTTGCMNGIKDTVEDNIIETTESAIIKKVKPKDYENKSSDNKSIKVPLEVVMRNENKEIYANIPEDSSIDERVKIILNILSEQCFNGLPINSIVNEDGLARIELVELDESKRSRASWSEDYLNDYSKEYTINNIVKNLLREDDKQELLKEVQLFYNEELVTID